MLRCTDGTLALTMLRFLQTASKYVTHMSVSTSHHLCIYNDNSTSGIAMLWTHKVDSHYIDRGNYKYVQNRTG